MRSTKLVNLAKTIRSKNAGVNAITFDIVFSDREAYERVRDCGAITRTSIASLFKVPIERVTTFMAFEPAMAIKFTIRRPSPAGGPGESDLFGCQQYAPLFDIEIPELTSTAVSTES